ncbi:hypothetical protein MAP00_005562 [Monascus purpureus]|nr:hypothetical protein MAP00_005562 [Monascus purpureus]
MQAVLHYFRGYKREQQDLSGRVAMVVGGSKGIGFEIARYFLQSNISRLMISSVNPKNGPQAIEKLKNEFGQDTNVEWCPCNVGCLKNIQQVFSGIAEREERLDILILSAGINSSPFELSVDGIERLFGCNWIGQSYIINLLYPLMRKTSKLPNAPAPRIVLEASDMHKMAPADVKFQSLEEINNDKLSPIQLYARSKLAMILGVRYGIHKKIIKANKDNIYVIAVHPGAVMTDMQYQYQEAYPGLFGKILTLINLGISKTPEQGATSALFAAMSPDIEKKDLNGAYIDDWSELASPSEMAMNEELGNNLWDLSESLIKRSVGPNALQNWNQIITA